MDYTIQPIATIRSPFQEKFGTPRQPGMTPSAVATIDFHEEYATPEAVRGLEGFSHLWLIFGFSQNWQQSWTPTVRPPRLGGNQRVGVYASRSPFRPNPLGLSAVRLLAIKQDKGRVSLDIEAPDLIDGTPIFDIKPYIAYSDAIPEAQSGFASERPYAQLTVVFSEVAQRQLEDYQDDAPGLEQLLMEALSLDPRPAYKRDQEDGQEYGVLLSGYNVRWRLDGTNVCILSIVDAGLE